MPKKVTKKTETKNAAPRRRPAKATAVESGPSAASTKTVTEVEIRARAYEIYRRGENPSDPTADWFQAEQELRSETGA